jgi:hypothetical protein
VQKDGWTVRVEQNDMEKARGWRIAMTHQSGPHRVEQEVANAEHIAAWHPARALAALAVIEAAREAIKTNAEWARSELDDAIAAWDALSGADEKGRG